MRKIFAHPVVFLLLAVLIGSIIFFGAKKTSGFSWFSLWTQQKNNAINNQIYVQKSITTDVLSDIIKAHTTLQSRSLMIAAIGGGSISNVPQYLASAQNLLMTDIVEYLENTSDRAAALDTLLGQLDFYQQNGVVYTDESKNIIQEQTSEYNRCTSGKDSSDKLFYQGLGGGEIELLQQGLDESQEYAQCQAKSRVLVNAHTAMLSRVEHTQGVVANLSKILTQNREVIIANFSLFKNGYLEKLIDVRNGLRSASPGTKE